MRRFLLTFALVVFATAPLVAQNTDIEALSGLQFSFGNPGARSLGMGGAFLGLADDASAAEANPSGLTILRRPELSVEARNYVQYQLFTTSGTFPDVVRTAFSHYSDRVVINFASAAYPITKRLTVAMYYHQPLQNAGGGIVAPRQDPNTHAVTQTPDFFLAAGGGGPISQADCIALRNSTHNPGACLEYRINPFISALDVRQRTGGVAAGWQLLPSLSIGGAVRVQSLKEAATTFRYDTNFQLQNIVAQLSSNDTSSKLKSAHSVTFAVGFKWQPVDKFSVGGVVKQGPRFDAPTFFAGTQTNGQLLKVADTKFHDPDIAGVGVSFRPIPVFTINADADYVKYSNLVDNFYSVVADVTDLNKPFKSADVVELHVGGEYFFPMKVPFAIRGGYWRDPAHSITWNGPLNTFNFIAEALLYPKTQAQNHYSIGGGFAWPQFQIDFGYDTSKYYKVGSISAVARF